MTMTEAELDEVLTFHWPILVRRVMADAKSDSFTKGFVRSIARHSKRTSWKPTSKQVRTMRQVLGQYSGNIKDDDDFDLTEDWV